MKLREFLKIHGITQTQFAQKVGVTNGLISLITRHKKNPSISLVIRIEEATNGAVKVNDLFSPEASSKSWMKKTKRGLSEKS